MSFSNVAVLNLQKQDDTELEEDEENIIIHAPSLTDIPRHMSVFSGVALIVGTMVGTGIFRTVGAVHSNVGSVGVSLTVWLCGGLISLCGALCYIELGTTFPHSGGEQVYLTDIFGPAMGFLYTWVMVVAIRPGSLAISSITFAEYLCDSLETIIHLSDNNSTDISNTNNDVGQALATIDATKAPQWIIKVVGIAFMVFLTGINIRSSRWSSKITDALFFVKLAMLSFIAITGWVILIKGHDFKNTVANGSLNSNWFEGTETNPSRYALAFYACLWAYDGWNSLNCIAGELKDPMKNLYRCVFMGVSVVTLWYLATITAYYAVLPADVVRDSTSIAVDFALIVFGPIGAVVIPFGIVLVVVGSMNVGILTSSRMMHASAKNGLLPSFLEELHVGYKTPVNALVVQAIQSCLFILFGSVETLLNIFCNGVWFFYAMVGTGVFVLHWRRPNSFRTSPLWQKARKKLAVLLGTVLPHTHVMLVSEEDTEDLKLDNFDEVELTGLSSESPGSSPKPHFVASNTHLESFQVPNIIAFLFTSIAWTLAVLPLTSAPKETLLSWLFILSGVPVWYGYRWSNQTIETFSKNIKEKWSRLWLRS